MPSLTYAELAKALKIAPASANRLARRKRWTRLKGNDGKVRVAVPEDALVRADSPPVSPMGISPDYPQAIPPDNPAHARLVTALENHIKTLQGENEALRNELVAEQDRSMRTLAAFASLAERLDVLAAERSHPWWRWLVG
jgi:hypothetical protein